MHARTQVIYGNIAVLRSQFSNQERIVRAILHFLAAVSRGQALQVRSLGEKGMGRRARPVRRL